MTGEMEAAFRPNTPLPRDPFRQGIAPDEAIRPFGWQEASDRAFASLLSRPGLTLLLGAPGTGKTLVLSDIEGRLRALGRHVRVFTRDTQDAQAHDPLPEDAFVLLDEVRLDPDVLDAASASHNLHWLLADAPLAQGRLSGTPGSSTVISLPTLTPAQAREFVATRLRQAGRRDDLLSPDALDLLVGTAGGVPRDLCEIAGQALRLATSEGVGQVGIRHMERAVGDFSAAPEPPPPRPARAAAEPDEAAPHERALRALAAPVAAAQARPSTMRRVAVVVGGGAIVLTIGVISADQIPRLFPPAPAHRTPATLLASTEPRPAPPQPVFIPIVTANPAPVAASAPPAHRPPPPAMKPEPPAPAPAAAVVASAPVETPPALKPETPAPAPATAVVTSAPVEVPPTPAPPPEAVAAAAPAVPTPDETVRNTINPPLAQPPVAQPVTEPQAAEPPVTEPPKAEGWVTAGLATPATPVHLVISYARHDRTGAERGAALAERLRRAGFRTGEPVPVGRTGREPKLRVFFAEDRAVGARVRAALGAKAPPEDFVTAPHPGSLPRPGTIELVIPASAPVDSWNRALDRADAPASAPPSTAEADALQAHAPDAAAPADPTPIAGGSAKVATLSWADPSGRGSRRDPEYFVEVQALDGAEPREVFAGYAEQGPVHVELAPDSRHYAWRVHAVERAGGHYNSSRWVRFDALAENLPKN